MECLVALALGLAGFSMYLDLNLCISFPSDRLQSGAHVNSIREVVKFSLVSCS